MAGGIRTLNDLSIRPKLITATNYVTTIYIYIQIHLKNFKILVVFTILFK